MKPALRWSLLGVALVGAAWLALFGDRDDGSVVGVNSERGPATGAAQRRTSPPAPPARFATERTRSNRDNNTEILELRVRTASSENLKSLFAATNFAPPRPAPAPAPKPTPAPAVPAPVAAVAPAPAPTAPPLPFVFVGKHFDGARWEVFVSRGEQTLILRAGQTIDPNYRVESIQPPRMVITYLPLDEKQTLNIGSPQ